MNLAKNNLDIQLLRSCQLLSFYFVSKFLQRENLVFTYVEEAVHMIYFLFNNVSAASTSSTSITNLL